MNGIKLISTGSAVPKKVVTNDDLAKIVDIGRTETTRAIFGIDPKESGEIILDGKEIRINKPDVYKRQI